jgi:hypothetical protein
MFTLDKSNGAFVSNHSFLERVIAFLVLVMFSAKNHCFEKNWRMTKPIVIYSKENRRHIHVADCRFCNTTMIFKIPHPRSPYNQVGFGNRLTIFQNVHVHNPILP